MSLFKNFVSDTNKRLIKSRKQLKKEYQSASLDTSIANVVDQLFVDFESTRGNN